MKRIKGNHLGTKTTNNDLRTMNFIINLLIIGCESNIHGGNAGNSCKQKTDICIIDGWSGNITSHKSRGDSILICINYPLGLCQNVNIIYHFCGTMMTMLVPKIYYFMATTAFSNKIYLFSIVYF